MWGRIYCLCQQLVKFHIAGGGSEVERIGGNHVFEGCIAGGGAHGKPVAGKRSQFGIAGGEAQVKGIGGEVLDLDVAGGGVRSQIAVCSSREIDGDFG